jgi:choline dehydrogenase-like flavoprotein
MGQLKKYGNIFVTDASLLAHCIRMNPALTITALAERNVEVVLKIKLNANHQQMLTTKLNKKNRRARGEPRRFKGGTYI